MSRRRELSVQTFPYVEKLRTAPACICPDVSAGLPDATQCSISYGISFQNIDMGRQLQLSGRCGFSSGRRSSCSGRASFIYGNCVHQIHRPDNRCHGLACQALIWKLCEAKVRLSGRQDNIFWTRLNSGKNLSEIWKADRTVVRPDASCLLSGWDLGISSQTLISTHSL
jgi:hypothetical protein